MLNERFHNLIIKLSFISCESDNCLYVKFLKGRFIDNFKALAKLFWNLLRELSINCKNRQRYLKTVR